SPAAAPRREPRWSLDNQRRGRQGYDATGRTPAAGRTSVTTIRIVLADDHAILRAGLRLLIESDPAMVVVGEAQDAAQALEVVRREQPHVLVLDISMPGGGTLETLAQIHEQLPAVKVLVLTMHADESYLRACL